MAQIASLLRNGPRRTPTARGGRRKQARSSRGYWRKCLCHEPYLRLKKEWARTEKEYQKGDFAAKVTS